MKVEFAVGKHSYVYGDYPGVISRLTPLVEPVVLLADRGQLMEAYQLLGLSHSFLRSKEDPTHEQRARHFFEKLIRLDPSYELNPALVPPDTILLYKNVRDGLAEELERERQEILRRQREAEERLRMAGASQVVVEKRRNSRWVAVVPFGVGQFQNDQPVAGALFLGGEVLAVSLSVGFFAAVEDLRLDSGRFAREDVSRAESMQNAQLIAGGAALALMAVGVIHALTTFQEELDMQRTYVKPTANGLVWEF